VTRQAGLEMVFRGIVPLAQALGPNEDMAVALMEPHTVTVCEKCGMEHHVLIAVLGLIAENDPDLKEPREDG
jgi:hypothetical protein